MTLGGMKMSDAMIAVCMLLIFFVCMGICLEHLIDAICDCICDKIKERDR